METPAYSPDSMIPYVNENIIYYRMGWTVFCMVNMIITQISLHLIKYSIDVCNGLQ